MSSQDLSPPHTITCLEPTGWVEIWVDEVGFAARIGVEGMHQNGRDTHVRQVRVWGERGGGDEDGWKGIR